MIILGKREKGNGDCFEGHAGLNGWVVKQELRSLLTAFQQIRKLHFVAPSVLMRSSESEISAGISWSLVSILAVTVLLLGGSSRPDVVQIAALRPAAAMALIPAIYLISNEAVRHVRVPVVLFGAFAIWMLVQLIPLPPALWQSLPDRNAIGALDHVAAEGDGWRSISVVPARTMNALASLLVPAAALALALALKIRVRDIFLIVAAAGAAHALLGLLQLVLGATSPLYPYSITSRGRAVGFLANENHSAVFSSVVMLVSARLFLDGSWHQQAGWLRIVGGAAFLLALLSVIVSGSRLGVVAGLFALGTSIVMVYLIASARASKNVDGRTGRYREAKLKVVRIGKFESRLLGDPRKLAMIGMIAILALAALFVMNGRAAGLEELLVKDSFGDLRFGLFPILMEMVGVHWLFGAGFGSFEEIYHIYEPTELLLPSYVNQAHNDWVQIVIEGGLPAVLITLMLLGWGAKQVNKIWRQNEHGSAIALFWIAAFGAIMAASIPDYPLRTPIFQVVGVWLIAALAKDAAERQAAL